MKHRGHGHQGARQGEDGCFSRAGISVAGVEAQDEVAAGGVDAVVGVGAAGRQQLVVADVLRDKTGDSSSTTCWRERWTCSARSHPASMGKRATPVSLMGRLLVRPRHYKFE